MMDQFIIEGGYPLSGTTVPGGNKNAAFPVLAACLLTEEPVIIRNVPDIQDVRTFRQLLKGIGVEVERQANHMYRLHARTITTSQPDPDVFGQIRGSLVLTGALLGRTGQAMVPAPGGDMIGRRRVDTHVQALQSLGATLKTNQVMHLHASRLQGADILLDEASVTGTENTVLAAVLARGTTIIRNAACEPHVQDLCNFLNLLGAQIEGVGSNVIVIHGVDRLTGGEFAIGPDYMEVGSLIGLGAVTGSKIRIQNAGVQHLRMTQMVLDRLGVELQIEGDDVVLPGEQLLTVNPDLGGVIPEIKDGPWPAFPPDLMSIAIVVATQSEGSVLFHEWMYESRLYFVDKLIRMGARVILCDPHRCLVQGPTRLHGEQVESPDIRAGMALLLAALCARGTSVISKVRQIDRGYERIEEKLRALGARIERVVGST
jgi:UDP-N-acetylglucosamine 1-carboxyvinyltransferase